MRSYTSPGAQAETQLIDGAAPGAAVVAGALVIADDWARAPAAKATRAMVYFMLTVGSRDAIRVFGKAKMRFELV